MEIQQSSWEACILLSSQLGETGENIFLSISNVNTESKKIWRNSCRNTHVCTHLTSGQPPRFTEDLLEEGRLDTKVLGDYIQAEEVSVDAPSCHGIAVTLLVPLCSFLQELDLVRTLSRKGETGSILRTQTEGWEEFYKANLCTILLRAVVHNLLSKHEVYLICLTHSCQ